MISGACEVIQAKLRSWHFILEPTKSTKAVEQNVTRILFEEENTGFRGGRKAVGDSRGGEAGEMALAIARLRYVRELTRTGPARQGRAAQPSPTAAICPLTHRRCLLPLLSR